MTIKFDLTGTNRKAFVKAISEITGAKAKYLFTPTYAYEIDYFTVTRDGALEFDDRADSEEIETLLESLDTRGFHAATVLTAMGAEVEDSEEVPAPMESAEQGAPVSEHVATQGAECAPTEETPAPTESAAQGAPAGLTVAMPLDKVNAGNLTNLLDAKGRLIQKALGIDATPIEISEDTVSFPWFTETLDADTVQAVTHFIAALCKMSVEQRRISPVKKSAYNEKYAFRCFLLRLGFIGAEYKTERKILLQNLTGSSAFKNGTKKEATEDEISE